MYFKVCKTSRPDSFLVFNSFSLIFTSFVYFCMYKMYFLIFIFIIYYYYYFLDSIPRGFPVCYPASRQRGVTSYLQEESKMAEDSQCYCICRKPYDSSQFMIGCDSCGEWFHGR